MVPGKEAGLQLSDRVPALDFRQSRAVGQMALESKLVESLVVERAKFRGQPAKRPDKSELRADLANDEAEPSLLRKLETILGFTLHLHEVISGRDEVRDQVVAAVGRIGQVTDFVRGIEGATDQIAAGPDMSRPWRDVIAKNHIGSSLKALQSALLDQLIAEPTELRASLVVSEARSGYHGKGYIDDTLTVPVAPLEAEIDRPAGDQGMKVRIRKQCRWERLGQNVQRRQGRRIAHQRQIDELLDLATFQLGPDPRVLSFCFLSCRMQRPFNAQMLEVVEA